MNNEVILKNFNDYDMKFLYEILSDNDVNKFLPWYPLKSIDETIKFYKEKQETNIYFYAICLKKDNIPIGYINLSKKYELGYGIKKEYWNRGIVTNACNILISMIKEKNIPYIVATHDKYNIASGKVLQKIGMKYCYSYIENWQPKNIVVTFRLYDFSFDNTGNYEDDFNIKDKFIEIF